MSTLTWGDFKAMVDEHLRTNIGPGDPNLVHVNYIDH